MRVWMLCFVLSCGGEATPAGTFTVDARPPDPFSVCTHNQCLHNCIPYPGEVQVVAAGVEPHAELFCKGNGGSVEPGGKDDRSIELRAERKPKDGAVDSRGAIGTGVTVSYTDTGTWSAVGPSLELVPGHCYRTAARIVLANGFAAAWANGPFSCY